MKNLKLFFFAVLAAAAFSSCTSVNHSMREPNVRVELEKGDFTLSERVTGEAKSTQILFIDFARLFNQKTGTIETGGVPISLASVPVVGTVLADKTSNYALYEMMSENPGYDVVFYPTYEVTVEKPFLGLGFIVKKTTVKASARLGRLK